MHFVQTGKWCMNSLCRLYLLGREERTVAVAVTVGDESRGKSWLLGDEGEWRVG
jgi:hypothetical protein